MKYFFSFWFKLWILNYLFYFCLLFFFPSWTKYFCPLIAVKAQAIQEKLTPQKAQTKFGKTVKKTKPQLLNNKGEKFVKQSKIKSNKMAPLQKREGLLL